MSGPTAGGQYTHSIMWHSVNYECIDCTHWYMTTVVIFPFWSLIHNSIFFMNVGSWCKFFQTGRNHIFLYTCVCFVLSCVAVWSWALNCVMAHDSTQIYVGFVGQCNIHCKFLSTLSGGVCYLMICLHNFPASYGPIGPTAVCNYCILYHFCEWYFVLVFCLYFMYKFIFYHLCIQCIVTCAPIIQHLAVVFTIKWAEIWHKIWLDRATRKVWHSTQIQDLTELWGTYDGLNGTL